MMRSLEITSDPNGGGSANNTNDSPSSPLSIVCGETLHNVKMEGCSGENEKDCDRMYSLYIPSSICKNDNDNSGGVIPLVFAMHCYGCPATVMKHWQKVGEDYNFVVVIPEGLARSWNAKYCCGYALEHKIDDVGFLQSIIIDLVGQYNFVSADVTYGVGWSNGGYMVTYASKLFRSIAPIAGYQYDDLQGITDGKPRGIFMHHSSNDQKVQITGCCTDPTMPKCCCGISNYAEQCTSITSIFDRWAVEVNGCSPNSTQVSLVDEANGAECITSTSPKCLANSTLCIYKDKGHFLNPSFQLGFPMTNDIANFFAQDTCSINNGVWSPATKQCSCSSGEGETLRYCLEKGYTTVNNTLLQKMELPTHSDSNTFDVAIIGVICGLVGFIVMVKSRANYIGWKRVPTEEDRSE